MNWITEHWEQILQVIGAVVSLATLICKLTPNTTDESILNKVIKVLSALSLCNADGSFIGAKEQAEKAEKVEVEEVEEIK